MSAPVTPAEAQEMLDGRSSGELGPLTLHGVEVFHADGTPVMIRVGTHRIVSEVYNLAATVAAEPARIAAAVEAVTAERDRWRDALRDAARHTYVTTPADNDDPEGLAQNIADVLTTLQEPSEERDAALAHAAELESALRAAREVIEEAEAEKCDMLRDLERLRVQRDALRAIIEGRTTPPTPAEIAAHEATGGRWRCVVPGALNMSVDAMHGHAAQLHREILAAAGYERSLWWATDAAARPCAWPLAAEVTP